MTTLILGLTGCAISYYITYKLDDYNDRERLKA